MSNKQKEIVEDKKKIYKTVRLGKDMLELIEHVKSQFFEEYGFHPKYIELTNLIAKRVKDNKLF